MSGCSTAASDGRAMRVVCDYIVVYARDTADNQVKAFVVEKDNPGYAATKIGAQDVAADGTERGHHPHRLPRVRRRPTAELQQLQRCGQGARGHPQFRRVGVGRDTQSRPMTSP